MENNTSVLAKYPVLKIVIAIAALLALYFAVTALRNSGRLGGNQSDASCYGYNCQPSISLGGRVVTTGYRPGSFSYGTLNIRSGEIVELTWSGVNVDRCAADWTQFTGTEMIPTVYGRVNKTKKFEVTCYKGNHRYKTSLKVKVPGRGGESADDGE